MTLEEALRAARTELSSHGVEDAALEAEVLLRHATGLSRSHLYIEFGREVAGDEERRFRGFIARRAGGEPAAYITGHREFYGLDFCVDRRVLIPRPESELLVDQAIELGREGARSFADVGTGSGCIAVSIAINLPQSKIYATDLSGDAVDVALANCRKHGVEERITLLRGDLAGPLPGRVDVIVANLPYVRQWQVASVNTHGFEPSLALDGGEDGLDPVRSLADQAASKLNPGGSLLFEIGQGQAQAAIDIVETHLPGAQTRVLPDLGGIPRVVLASLGRPRHQEATG
jgi:release factor glutamine methyltransferase